jgi:hypothetical protein
MVGHSWDGAVITQVGNDPKVAALVCSSQPELPNAGNIC